jgi:hypothetical protein
VSDVVKVGKVTEWVSGRDSDRDRSLTVFVNDDKDAGPGRAYVEFRLGEYPEPGGEHIMVVYLTKPQLQKIANAMRAHAITMKPPRCQSCGQNLPEGQ